METNSTQKKTNHTFNRLLYLILGVFLGISISLIYSKLISSKESKLVAKSNYVFGVDISHYQEQINWSKVKKSHHPIKYVFMRSTMGKDGKDIQFADNWKKAKEFGYIRGAYHYYRPNENSTLQFKNYAKNTTLKPGDFIPILDAESLGKLGGDDLRKGVLNWLKLAEKKYGVKPMIYSGRTIYEQQLKTTVKDYPKWIASYSPKNKIDHIEWDFHQFTKEVRIKGISGYVDGNDFNGNLSDLEAMCIPVPILKK